MALVKYNNNSISDITTAGQLASGNMVLIKEQTASSSASISFVDGSSDVVLDSTYPIYKFQYINCHPSNNDVAFQVNFRDGGSSYDATKTSTYFYANHNEADSDTSLGYYTPNDVAQGTGVQKICLGIGNGNDESVSGEMFLFNPSSTTFVKHYLGTSQEYYQDNRSINTFYAGYCNVTVAIDGVQFSMSSGNIDSGTIKLYGIKDS